MFRYAFASLLSLGLLGVFLFIISALVFFFTPLMGMFGLAGILVLEAVLFALVWRCGPWVNDIINQWFYKLAWISPEKFTELDPDLKAFIEQVCAKEGIAVPKFGVIDDDNPQAFTYGSDHWNARMVFTYGVFKILDKDERKAVAAHELGHIVHRDFIVMTMASFILTALYTIGRTLMGSKDSSDNKDRGALAIVGIISLVFYYIGTYVLLYLSRMREYWADEYSKEKTGSGNYLSTALVKIAYGIVSAKEKQNTSNLMEGTRTMGIYDHKASKTFGLVGSDYVNNSDKQTVMHAIAYDLKNLWAFWLELSSSHPLTGKRIAALIEGESAAVFDVNAARNIPFDNAKHQREFATDWLVSYLWIVLGAIGLAGMLFVDFKLSLVLAFFGIAIGFFIKTFYKFPSQNADAATVDVLMADLYASPIRGRPCQLTGQIMGRGVPGYMFSEDLMFQDKTGIIYLDYQAGIPLIGNLIFALKDAQKLVGHDAECKGWFFRGMGQMVCLDYLESKEQQMKVVSRQKTWSILGACIPLLVGVILLVI
ncbi:MAG: zinc metalloprotease HtpX [Candidatus Micrarchaeia archaeon]|jgi:Zn-dependent protease with chaperone function